MKSELIVLRKFGCVVALGLLTLCASQAATRTWDGSASGNWSVGANWVGDVAPEPGDSLIFPVTATRYITTNTFAANRAFGGIAFNGSNYVLRGSSIVLEDDLRALAQSGPVTIDLGITVDSTNAVTDFEARFNSIPTFNGGLHLLTPGHTLKFLKGQINVSGAVSGPGNVEVVSCDLYFNGSSVNTFGGSLELDFGTVYLNKTTANAAIPSTVVTTTDLFTDGSLIWIRSEQIANDAQLHFLTLELNGNTETMNDFYISHHLKNGTLTVLGDIFEDNALIYDVDINGRLLLPSGSHRLISNGGTALLQNEVTGPGALVKVGEGRITLGHSNSFTGSVIVSNGILAASFDHAFGGTAAGVTVRQGASVFLGVNPGTVTINDETLTLEGRGFGPSIDFPDGFGALHGHSESNAWNGPVIFSGTASISAQRETLGNLYNKTNSILRLGGVVQGNGTLEKEGKGTVAFTGAQANTHTGTTFVREGVLLLAKTGGAAAIADSLRIGDSDPAVETVINGGPDQIADTSLIVMDLASLWNLNGFNETIGNVVGAFASDAGEIALGGGRLTINFTGSHGNFPGTITGAGGFTKQGSGHFELDGDNTYSDTTIVQQGRLQISGSQPASAVAVFAGATLEGSGTVGHVSVVPGATLRPGGFVQIGQTTLTTSNLTISTGATVAFTFPVVTNQAQLNVRGTVALNEAALTLDFGYLPAVGESFVLIANDGNEAVSGTFLGIPGGNFAGPNGLTLHMAYGNDVVLSVPSQGASPIAPGGSNYLDTIILGGNANGVLDPNECAQLKIPLFNDTTNSGLAFTAYLSCDVPGVFVHQGKSTYPAIAPGEWAYNATPFQITTPSNLVCGTNLPVTLTIVTASNIFYKLPATLFVGAPDTALRFDSSDVPHPIADGVLVESILKLSEFVGHAASVEVELHALHELTSDLHITLIAPNGLEIPLVQKAGAGANFGTGCAEGQTTRFAMQATQFIGAATAPFSGIYRPAGNLNLLRGLPAGLITGEWKLRIFDDTHFNVGTLQCWSLLISPATCTGGGGACAACPGYFTGDLNRDDLATEKFVTLSEAPSVCYSNALCNGPMDGARFYDAYSFSNHTAEAVCVTIAITTDCTNFLNRIESAAFLGSFNPAEPCNGYLGDSGNLYNFGNANLSYQVTVPGHTNFQVVVVTRSGSDGCAGYTLLVDGNGLCPVTLNIAALTTNQMRLDWPSHAIGYELQRTDSLPANGWTSVTNAPVIHSGHFTVTNEVTEPKGFYRLHKP